MDITLQEIADIVDESKGRNYFSNNLEKALIPLFKKLKNIEKDKEKISLTDLFKLDDVKSAKFKRRYENALNAFIKGFEEKVSDFKKTSIAEMVAGDKAVTKSKTPNTPPPLLPAQAAQSTLGIEKLLKNAMKPKFDTEEGKDDLMMDVNVVSIDERVIELLGGVVGKQVNAVAVSNEVTESGGDKSGSILGKILKTIAIGGLAAGLVAGGVKLAWEGFIKDSPFRGFLKILGTQLLKSGLNLFQSFTDNIAMLFKPIGKILDSKIGKAVITNIGKIPFPKFLTKLLNIGKLAGKGSKLIFKSIPFLGSIISLVFAFKRFKEGDVLGGLLELGAAIPFIGPAFSIVSMFRDFTMTTQEKKEQSSKGFLGGLKKWFLNLTFVKSISNVFAGLSLIFGGNGIDDVNKGIELLLKDNSLLHVIFPWVSPLMSIIQYFSGGKFMEHMGGLGTKLVDFGGWIWQWMSDTFSGAWDYVKKLVSNLWDSDVVKLTRLKVEKSILGFVNTFYGIFEAAVAMINGVRSWANDRINELLLAYNKIVPKVWEKELLPDSEKIELPSQKELEKNISKIEDEIKAIELKRKTTLETKNNDNERMHQERLRSDEQTRQIIQQAGAAQVAATQAGANQISASMQNRVGDGGVTNIFTDNLSKQNENFRKRAITSMF